MTSPYGPILTGVGLLEGGKLTPAGRKRYVDEVLALLLTGNADGRGGSPSTRIFNSLVPLPPIPGPTIPNPTTLSLEPVFWFSPDPLAALLATLMVDEKACPMWNAIFPDLLYAKTAEALDLPGCTPLFPLFDVSVPFPNLKGFPVSLPDLAVGADVMPPPMLLLKLADLGIELKIPSIPAPPIPPKLPSFGSFSIPLAPSLDVGGISVSATLPSIPTLAGSPVTLPVPPLVLMDLLIGLIKLPFDLLLKLVLPPDIGIVMKLLSFEFGFILDLALDVVLKLMNDLKLMIIVPKVFVASLLIYIKNIVAMVIVDIVGMLVGAGGVLTKLVAGATGLI